MQAAVFHAPGDIRIENVPDPKIEQPTDAIVRITHTAICGSDLWFYRGLVDYREGRRTGHEPMGVVEAVGSEVRSIKPGDFVIAPFSISDGTCEFCRKGLQTSCEHGTVWAKDTDGAQGEAVRVPLADGTLVRIPERVEGDEKLLEALFPLTDVMGTGHHAALCAGVREGVTCVVVGDGAVGLCGVLAAKRLGAERIIAMGHHTDRLEKARSFGATDLVTSRGEEAVERGSGNDQRGRRSRPRMRRGRPGDGHGDPRHTSRRHDRIRRRAARRGQGWIGHPATLAPQSHPGGWSGARTRVHGGADGGRPGRHARSVPRLRHDGGPAGRPGRIRGDG